MRGQLQRWQPPDEMWSLLETWREPHGFYTVGQRSMQHWREAFCAHGFADTVKAEAVRLGEDPPDFYLRLEQEEIPFELVEVREPGQRIGDEFDKLAELANRGAKLPVQHYDPTDELLALAGQIASAVAAKANKGYPTNMVLAVKAQAIMFPEMEAAIRDSVRDAVKPHLSAFRAIWVSGWNRLFTYSADGADPIEVAAQPVGGTTLST